MTTIQSSTSTRITTTLQRLKKPLISNPDTKERYCQPIIDALAKAFQVRPDVSIDVLADAIYCLTKETNFENSFWDHDATKVVKSLVPSGLKKPVKKELKILDADINKFEKEDRKVEKYKALTDFGAYINKLIINMEKITDPGFQEIAEGILAKLVESLEAEATEFEIDENHWDSEKKLATIAAEIIYREGVQEFHPQRENILVWSIGSLKHRICATYDSTSSGFECESSFSIHRLIEKAYAEKSKIIDRVVSLFGRE